MDMLRSYHDSYGRLHERYIGLRYLSGAHPHDQRFRDRRTGEVDKRDEKLSHPRTQRSIRQKILLREGSGRIYRRSSFSSWTESTRPILAAVAQHEDIPICQAEKWRVYRSIRTSVIPASIGATSIICCRRDGVERAATNDGLSMAKSWADDEGWLAAIEIADRVKWGWIR